LLPLDIFARKCAVLYGSAIGRLLPGPYVRYDRGSTGKQNNHEERKCYLHGLASFETSRQSSVQQSRCLVCVRNPTQPALRFGIGQGGAMTDLLLQPTGNPTQYEVIADGQIVGRIAVQRSSRP
jgi:hypothetical protein